MIQDQVPELEKTEAASFDAKAHVLSVLDTAHASVNQLVSITNNTVNIVKKLDEELSHALSQSLLKDAEMAKLKVAKMEAEQQEAQFAKEAVWSARSKDGVDEKKIEAQAEKAVENCDQEYAYHKAKNKAIMAVIALLKEMIALSIKLHGKALDAQKLTLAAIQMRKSDTSAEVKAKLTNAENDMEAAKGYATSGSVDFEAINKKVAVVTDEMTKTLKSQHDEFKAKTEQSEKDALAKATDAMHHMTAQVESHKGSSGASWSSGGSSDYSSSSSSWSSSSTSSSSNSGSDCDTACIIAKAKAAGHAAGHEAGHHAAKKHLAENVAS
jgi:hypothetical protein